LILRQPENGPDLYVVSIRFDTIPSRFIAQACQNRAAPASPSMPLSIGEGVETVLAARQIGFRPAWVLGSAGAVGRRPTRVMKGSTSPA
jgi:hypothetical protein